MRGIKFNCPRCSCSATAMPIHDAEQEARYLARISEELPDFRASAVRWMTAVNVRFLECWNYRITCGVCGNEHKYWVGPGE